MKTGRESGDAFYTQFHVLMYMTKKYRKKGYGRKLIFIICDSFFYVILSTRIKLSPDLKSVVDVCGDVMKMA